VARRNQITIWGGEGVGQGRKGGKEGKKKERKTEDKCIREYIGRYGVITRAPKNADVVVRRTCPTIRISRM